MSRIGMFKAGVGAVLLAATVLSGCVVTAGPPRVYAGATISVAPPPPPVEEIGVAPAPGYVWFGGYWDWVGGRHVWVRGHWAQGRAGYHWVARRWYPAGGGYRMVEGHWER